MRSFREKYEVTVLPSHMLDSDLGDVVEAYDSKADRSWGCMVGWWFVVLAGLGLGIYNIYDTSQRDARLSLVEQILPFAILAAGIIVHFVLLSRHNLCQRIFVCRQGVQWEKYNRRSGRISQSRTVYWEQVGSVVSKKTRRYTSKSKGDDSSIDRYQRTTRTLEINATHGATLLKISGKYSNEHEQEELFTWIWFAVKAVEKQWASVRLPQLESRMHDEGQVTMPVKGNHALVFTTEGVSYKDKTISAANLVVHWRSKDENLALRDASEKRNIVQKFLNLKELSIPVNTMPDGCLVLPLLHQLYGVEMH